MEDWTSYRPADFVPYTAESWFALVERVGEDLWPFHVFTIALGLAMPMLVRSGRGRIAFVLLALAWAWVGWAFMVQRYAFLNWAGEWLGWVFFGQAALLAALATGWRWARAERRRRDAVQWIGLAVALVGLAGLPAITGTGGGAPFRAETFGIHPDPTAVTTIGIALLGLRPGAMALALSIPVVWCVVSGVHMNVLGIAWWPLPLLVSGCALIAFGRYALAGHGSSARAQPPK